MKSNKQTVADFGVNQLEKISLANGRLKVEILNLGATIYRINFPDCEGNDADLVLGYPSWLEYLTNNDMLGCVAGRFANRIANASFSLNGNNYKITANNGKHSLHSGMSFQRKFYRILDYSETHLSMETFSPDGEDGFPGNLKVKVTYTLANETIKILYEAETDKDTVINLTNHSYFNLAGHNSGSIIEHEVEIFADKFLSTDKDLIPVQFETVYKTPFDFTKPTVLNSPLSAPHQQIKFAGGIDHYYLLPDRNLSFLACKVFEPYSRRCLEVYTDQPGLQFYTSNHIDGLEGKDGSFYGKFPAFCVECQHAPNSPNRPDFPSTILKAGELLKSETHYKFSHI